MPLSTGARLGPYTIMAPIGAGGMGEVYRARDSRLDRDVAIKILPEAFAADPERLARFEREAKTLASLNHPHIAQIYGIENDALIMELVDGEDLSARIARGPMPSAEALPIAQQIADALEAAHERGIIHRDLKPANIKVSADGAVKVLDFGLAKAIEGREADGDPRNSPTMSLAGTRAGMVLGTAAYMAPEQARGHAVDRRADIWAFGVVLFEMLSGAQVFGGETISDVLASVLKNDLDWNALPADLPAPIVALLRRCLNPDRKARLRDIGEARIAIAGFLADPRARVEPAPGTAPASSRAWQIAVAALAVTLIASIGTLAFRVRAPVETSRRFIVAPPTGVSAYVSGRPSVSMAPDDWTVVFVGLDNGVPHLFVRGPSDFDPRRLAGTVGASNPEFSPDGRTVVFFAENRLKTMALDGGTASLAPVNDPRGISWVDDATLVYTPESIGGVLELSINGGPPRALTTIDEKAGERTHRWPHALPGGRWVLFTVGMTASPDNYDDSRIDAVDRQTGERRAVFQNASMARHAPTGHLVFARGGSLFAVRFDASTVTVSGTPVSILQGLGGDLTTGAAHMSWSRNGTFAYVPGDVSGGLRQLAWSDLKGARQSIPLPPALYNDVRLSPDGTRAAVAQGSSGLADLWVYAFARGTYTRLTFTGVNATPVWSANDRDIYYTAIDTAGSRTTIFRTSADGGGEHVPLTTIAATRAYVKHVDREGRWALIDYVAFGGARSNVGRVALTDGATIEPLVDTRADEYGAALSPDGRFVAYHSDEDGQPQVFVRELARSTGRWQVSNAGGEEPMWAPDGHAIYYRLEGRLMRVPVDTRTAFQTGLPALVLSDVYNMRSDTGLSYDPHPDGTRLLMIRAADVTSGGSVRLITRWFDELRAIK
ncbi:MAG: protein kinase [Acidobacteriota bacterium]|nr:protein kinase [Acidobacteriota bacterium]